MKKIGWSLFAFLSVGVGLYPILYFLIDPRFGLLSTKSAVLLAEQFYQIGFRAHIIFGGLALLTGWSQFSPKLRQQRLHLHRLLGKIYVLAVLLSGLAAVGIAFFATGGAVAAVGFGSLGVFWLFSTAKSWLAIRQKRIAEHQRWMVYSFAACFAAVTLRLWLPFLTFLFDGEFVAAYRIVAWLCWVPNLVFAFFYARREASRAGEA